MQVYQSLNSFRSTAEWVLDSNADEDIFPLKDPVILNAIGFRWSVGRDDDNRVRATVNTVVQVLFTPHNTVID